jgi:hypothetical protein
VLSRRRSRTSSVDRDDIRIEGGPFRTTFDDIRFPGGLWVVVRERHADALLPGLNLPRWGQDRIIIKKNTDEHKPKHDAPLI